MAGLNHLKASYFHFDPIVTADTKVYTRKYGRANFRDHEAIMKGTEVSFTGLVNPIVTEDEANKVMHYMGRYVGLTPYGFNLGYGTFNLVKLDIKEQ
jgi:hypothetical protein